MKRTLLGALAATAALGVTIALIPAGAVTAASPVTNPQACARMAGYTNVVNQPTPVCGLVYTSGSSSVVIPADAPRMVYGVVIAKASGIAPDQIVLRTGKLLALAPAEAQRWRYEPPAKVSHTIVRAEIVNNRVTKTWPYVFIGDDALVDHFGGQGFEGRVATGNKSKQVWTRVNWSPKGQIDGRLAGVIANYNVNIKDGGICHQAVSKQYPTDMAKTFGDGGKVKMTWVPNTFVGGESYFVITTGGTKFVRSAPTLYKLITTIWNPAKTGKWNFKATSAPTSFNRWDFVKIGPRVQTVKCSP